MKDNKKKEENCIIMETGYMSEDWIIDSSAMPINESRSEDEEDELRPM